jgi:spore coat polysaccharide biosynthesis protein SpsF
MCRQHGIASRWSDTLPALAAERTRDRPVIIVQARMGSSRLPGKVLADLCGTPVLGWLLKRLRLSQLATGVVVATTTADQDGAVAALCERMGVPAFRGHPSDVLSRYCDVAAELDAPSIVRVSADSPFVDDRVADTVIEAHLSGTAEITQNHRPPGWPLGTATEVLDRDCLERLDREASDVRHREHVTLYAYETPGAYDIHHVPPPPELEGPELQFCVDTPDDLERLRRVCSRLGGADELRLEDVVAHALSSKTRG